MYLRSAVGRKLYTDGGEYVEEIPILDDIEVGYLDVRPDMKKIRDYIFGK